MRILSRQTNKYPIVLSLLAGNADRTKQDSIPCLNLPHNIVTVYQGKSMLSSFYYLTHAKSIDAI